MNAENTSEWRCESCDQLNGNHKESCAVGLLLTDVEQCSNGSYIAPTTALEEALICHQHLLRTLMVNHGCSTGEIVVTTLSVVVQQEADGVRWTADAPPIVVEALRKIIYDAESE